MISGKVKEACNELIKYVPKEGELPPSSQCEQLKPLEAGQVTEMQMQPSVTLGYHL